MISKLSLFRRLKYSFTGQPTIPDPFSQFLLKNTRNKKYLLIATAGIFIQFILFKLCYPFADFFSDSYTYINTAVHHYDISFRPIGYSRFLALIHLMTNSDTALVFIQYGVLQAGGLLLFFSLRYFFSLSKIISNILFALLVFNPILLYLSNCICSDALFVGLSLIWINQLIWIINRPKWIQLLPLAVLLFIIFTLRYAAIYLPAVAVLALLLSPRNRIFKITGVTLTILPIFMEVQRIRHITKNQTGTPVFSAFGSWMAVNNVMHMYPYIEIKDTDLPSAECVAFNKIIKHYFDTLPVSARPYPGLKFELLWASNSPIRFYRSQVEKQTRNGNYFNSYHAVAPVFSQFSNRLIMQHPGAFAQYYLWPNVKYYCSPILESWEIYNEGEDKVDSTAIAWFHYKSEQVTCIDKEIQKTILQPFPYWYLLVNIVFCLSLAVILIRAKRYSISPHILRLQLLMGSFWIINFCFSIYAAPIILRFQILPMIVFTIFAMVNINQFTIHYRNRPAPKG